MATDMGEGGRLRRLAYEWPFGQLPVSISTCSVVNRAFLSLFSFPPKQVLSPSYLHTTIASGAKNPRLSSVTTILHEASQFLLQTLVSPLSFRNARFLF